MLFRHTRNTTIERLVDYSWKIVAVNHTLLVKGKV